LVDGTCVVNKWVEISHSSSRSTCHRQVLRF
jgi:hypothetical protein